MRNIATSIADLIDSGQFQLAESELESLTDCPLKLIFRLELLTYFNRLDEAGLVLSRAGMDFEPWELARFGLARGEFFYWRSEYEYAKQDFTMAASLYRFSGDAVGLAKSYYCLARVMRRSGLHEEARCYLHEAVTLLGKEERKNKYLLALIELNLAMCAHQLGHDEDAAKYFSRSSTALEHLEGGRYYGLCLTNFGLLLLRRGEFTDCIPVLRTAIDVLHRIGAAEDIGGAFNNLALALIRLSRFDEAERTLREAEEILIETGNIADVSMFLDTFADLYLGMGKYEKALECVSRAVELADLSNNHYMMTEALVTRGKINIRRKEFALASRCLEKAVQIARSLNSDSMTCRALVYLAESYVFIDPTKAEEYLRDSAELVRSDAFLRSEHQRIATALSLGRSRVRVSPKKLVVDATLLPPWHIAKEELLRFLLENALIQSGGNLQKAGDIMGVTKAYVGYLRKKYRV
jgi:tetratricopeptide (TPR) repeat protein